MTFDEWWNDDRDALSTVADKRLAKSAWNAATAAERQRCREIALKTKDQYASSSWKCCAEIIADEIGE